MAKILLHSYLKLAEFSGGQYVTLTVDPATQFGFVGTAEGGVERLRGTPQVIVPTYDWVKLGVNEDEVVAKVLVEAAEANPLKLGQWSQMDQTWSQLRGLRAILVNPATVGKFRIPQGIPTLKYASVPESRVIALKTPDIVGYYIKQGAHLRNVLAHNKRGVYSIQVYEPVPPKPEADPELEL